MNAFWSVFLNLLLAFWDNLVLMAPYLLFGFGMAGVLSAIIPAALVERHLGGRSFSSVWKAALFGVPLPLCSCGVIPVTAAIRRQGAGKGATAAFLISTPQTGVDSLFVTYSLLGPAFAALRPLAAFSSGLVGGLAVSLAEDRKPADGPPPPPKDRATERENVLLRMLRYGFITLPRDLGKTLVFGLVIAGVIAILIPERFFEQLPGGGGGFGAMVLMALVGIPMYVCATASVPIAAALVAKGLSPGAAMVFLMTGPVTNGAAFSAMFRFLGRRAGVVYLISIFASALAVGLLLDHGFPSGYLAAQVKACAAACHEGSQANVGGILSAVGLLAVMAWAMRPRVDKQSAPQPESPPAASPSAAPPLLLHVEDMTCAHCARSVREALLACPGVQAVSVDLPAKRVTVSGPLLDEALLRDALVQSGFHPNQDRPALNPQTPEKSPDA